MEALAVRAPAWTVSIAGKDVTAAIMSYVTSVTYTDHVHGESDEVELTLEDSSRVWCQSWYPTQGDKVVVTMGYRGEAMLPCGAFAIEEIELSGDASSGDTMHIRALASGTTKPQRTKRSQAYESTTLAGLAKSVASRHGYSVVGDIDAVPLTRVTQHQETDLKFLKRVAGKYGYVFTVKGDQLVFTKYKDLRSASPVLTIRRTDVARYSLRDKSLAVYKDAVCAYHNAKKKRCLTHRAKAEGATSGDTLKLVSRCENEQQAKLQSEAALERANDAKYEGSLTLEGNPRLVAGLTIRLSGFGQLDGVWLIYTSRHRTERSAGYTTELEIKRGHDTA